MTYLGFFVTVCRVSVCHSFNESFLLGEASAFGVQWVLFKHVHIK